MYLNKNQQRLSDSIFRNLKAGNCSVAIMERKIEEYLDQARLNRECAAEIRRQGNSEGHVEAEKAFLRSAAHQDGNAEATQDAINRYKA